ncbi:hypothetical protein SUDANB95_01277 [Actinosynnema sp. ALI-1.44]
MVTPPVVAALVEAGATRMLAPASLGGGEMDLPSWLVAVEDLARADGPTGWTAMTTSATSALAWCLPADGAAEVLGSPTSVVAGTAAPVGVGDRARLRLACSHAAAEAASVTRLAFDLGGGSAVFADSPLQRCLRDAHVAAQHGLVSRRLFETYGAVRLGVAVDTSRL